MNTMQTLTKFLLILSLTSALCHAEEYRVKPVEALPEGVPRELVAALNQQGVSIEQGDEVAAQLWFGKTLSAKKGFTPSFSIKYPFSEGQFIGLLKVVKQKEYTDFRGQELAPGLYTLRYGLQPEDGNHVGTSIVRDFLLALPVSQDKSPKPLSDLDKLFAQSSEAARTTHPAIFAMQGLQQSPEKPVLEHNSTRDLWLLNTSIEISTEESKTSFPFQMVVVGHAEG
jgi:hypothetical protein